MLALQSRATPTRTGVNLSWVRNAFSILHDPGGRRWIHSSIDSSSAIRVSVSTVVHRQRNLQSVRRGISMELQNSKQIARESEWIKSSSFFENCAGTWASYFAGMVSRRLKF